MITTEEFVKRSKAIYGEKYDYSKTRYTGSNNEVEIICPIHGPFFQKACLHMEGSGCPECRVRSSKYSSRRLTTGEFIEKSRKVHGDIYDYSKCNYTGWMNDVEIICGLHGSFMQKPAYHLSGQGCPKCGLSGKSVSASAKKFYNRLTYVFDPEDIDVEYTSDEYPFKCDFHIRSRNMYIEYRGNWTHNGHPFNPNNAKDRNALFGWKIQSDYEESYGRAIEVWTKKEPLVRSTAKANGLNFLEFWKGDLEDLDLWISAGCPDGHDYDCKYSWMHTKQNCEVSGTEEGSKPALDRMKIEPKCILYCVFKDSPDKKRKIAFYFRDREDAELFTGMHEGLTVPAPKAVSAKDASKYIVDTINKVKETF